MGVPSFFRNIVKYYSGVTFWDPDLVIDHFFIDFNAMIYNVIHKINGDSMTAFEFENTLLTQTLRQLERVVKHIVKPRKTLVIAMDGPAPRAKMIQQRHRRYKTIKEAEFHAYLERKYQQNIKRLNWNRSAISPGTVFMKRLSDRIKESMERLTGIETIVFSDSSVPGEGEHKIMPKIYELMDDDKTKNDSIAIYSPDADMIVLSMITHKNNIYIFKENETETYITDSKGDKTEFLFLSVDRCREGFMTELLDSYEIEGMTEIELSDRFLIDYSFLTFLCGNDFVVAIPYLKMKENGMETLLKIYNELFMDESITNENSDNVNNDPFLISETFQINLPFFKAIVNRLRDIELVKFQHLQRKRDRIRKKSGTEEIRNSDRNDFEPWKDEFMRFEHEYYYSPLHPQFDKYNKKFDTLDYYKDDWKTRYNRHFFGNESKNENNSKFDINDVCKEYMKSLQFCLEYYLKGIPSWEYYYLYRAAPTFTDLSEWLETNNNNNTLNFEFNLGKPFSPFEQLLLVLPTISFGLLPKPLRQLPIKLETESYPRKFELDILLGGKYIYSEPILPEIDPETIRKFVKSKLKELSEGEQKRNLIT